MAFEYVVQNGLCLNQSYPYNATDGQCRNQTCTKKVHIDKYYDVPHNNEKQLDKSPNWVPPALGSFSFP